MSTDTLTRAPARKKRRRRFRFSLNGLAIQLSAFALSFTLVALLVVSGSQAAFVEQNQVVTQYVPIGTAAPTGGSGHRATHGPTPPASTTPTTEPPASPSSPVPTPTPTSEPPVTQVRLTDSSAGTAMFADPTLLPGVTVQRCISVIYDGNVDPGVVRLFAAPTSGALAPYLDLTVEVGQQGASSAGCAGFTASGTVFAGTLAAFAAAHTDYATGLATWDPGAGRETRTFRVGLTVSDDPAGSGASATFGFSWRAEAS